MTGERAKKLDRYRAAQLAKLGEETADGFRWEDPPADRMSRGRVYGRTPHDGVVRLEDNPGRWARLRLYRSESAARSARARIQTHYPADEFEFVAVGFALYGRSLLNSNRGGEG